MSSRTPLRNVTVTLEEEWPKGVRIEAARRDTSVSPLLGELLKERTTAQDGYGRGAKCTETQAVSAEHRPLPDARGSA